MDGTPERATLEAQETGPSFLGLGVVEGIDYNGGVEFGVIDLFCLVHCNGDMTLCICQNLQDWTVKRMDFTVCKLHLNKNQKVL